VKYNMLTVEREDIGSNRFNQVMWLCRCDCGAPALVIASYVRLGRTKSCGCLRAGNRLTHGHRGSRSRAYAAWSNMKNRCDSPNNREYVGYGGRGIAYDPAWAKFENFLADMGEPGEGLSIDRIDNDKGYYKDNCRWADKSTQRRNKRPETLGGRLVWCEIEGERLILVDAVRKYGVVPYQTVVNRLQYGWSPEEAVLTPYTRGFSHAPDAGRRFEHDGKNLTLGEWSKETGIGRVTILKRIQAGVPLETALTYTGNLRSRSKTSTS
jgi:hypothetical protein